MPKGLTYVEILIVLGLIPLVMLLTLGLIRFQDYLRKTRDLQRLQDLNALNVALSFYFKNASQIDPDGPYLENRGVDESLPTIFVSVPAEKDKFFEKCFYYPTEKTYYIYQSNKNDYQKIDGQGWVPIDFKSINNTLLSNLPTDPINSLNSGLYYLYGFQKNPPQYEISAALESNEFRQGGFSDKVSTDGGNDPNRIELGTNLNIIPPFVLSF